MNVDDPSVFFGSHFSCEIDNHEKETENTKKSRLKNILESWQRENGSDNLLLVSKYIQNSFRISTTELDLSSSHLKNIPDIYEFFLNLKILVLAFNCLSSLSPKIEKLTSLEWLDLKYNQLEFVPEFIWGLKNLKTLNLSHNKLTEISSKIGNLKNLTFLDLSINPIKFLPQEIEKLTNLISLQLSQNELKTIPREIGQLKNLESLSIANNFLESLPREIEGLAKIELFFLSQNHFSTFPLEITTLKTLRGLAIDKNGLTSIPEEIERLSHLQFLYLNKNQLTCLPLGIARLTNLESLVLDDNQLTSLPSKIKSLKCLKSLLLNKNQLTQLPTEIGGCSQLTDLLVEKNPLKTLPLSIVKLIKLNSFFIDETSIKIKIFIDIQGKILRIKKNKNLEDWRKSQKLLKAQLELWLFVSYMSEEDILEDLRRDEYKRFLEKNIKLKKAVEMLNIHQTNSLNIWLKRLMEAPDIEVNRQGRAVRICQILEVILTFQQSVEENNIMGMIKELNAVCKDNSSFFELMGCFSHPLKRALAGSKFDQL